MPARYWFLAIIVSAGLLAWSSTGGRPMALISPTNSAKIEPQPNPVKNSLTALGNLSCSAQGCHGAVSDHPQSTSMWGTDETDRLRWRHSSTIFRGNDPHRRSVDVLHEERSTNIQKLLGTKTPAWEDSRCLACHANPTTANDHSGAGKLLHAEGVSCEACHGNAQQWIEPHTKWTAKTDRDTEYPKLGMTKLSDVTERSMVCAGCHVGAPADEKNGIPRRDVNHDLIAAGHPRLNPDLGTYLAQLPAHWVEKNRQTQPAEFLPVSESFNQWWRGRQAVTIASLQLLADRADVSKKEGRSWPELADHDCFRCHRGLEPKRSAFSPFPPQMSSGLGWDAPPMVEFIGWRNQSLLDLQRLMRQTGPNPEAIRQHAKSLADDGSREMHAGKPGSKEALIQALVNAPLPTTWVDACQRFYALQLLHRTFKLGNANDLESIRPLLQFQRDPTEINSPATADLLTAGKKLKAFAEQLAPSLKPNTLPKSPTEK